MKRFVFLILTLPIYSVQYPVPPPPAEPRPWFTGPLLSPPANVIPVGHVNIEPYIYAVCVNGFYESDGDSVTTPNFWTNFFQVLIEPGITSWMDFQITPTLFYNVAQGESSWVFGDLSAGFNFQLLTDPYIDKNWAPGLKLSLRETFPTGTYQNLDPSKHRTQLGGQGAYISTINLVLSKSIHLHRYYYFNTYLSFAYNLPISKSVQGFNFYGGGFKTKGKYHLGQNFTADLAFECNLSRNWVYTMDIVYSYSLNSRFQGVLGTDSVGNPAIFAQGSSSQLSLAPALEYNWNQSMGLVAGCWFTAAGKLSNRFISGVVAFNYYK